MKTLEDVLEEIAPAPDPDFVAEMEQRMRQGFPREGRKRFAQMPRIAWPSLRPRAFAAVAASAALALLVSVSLIGGDGEQPVTPQALDGAPAETMSGGGDEALRESAPSQDDLARSLPRQIPPTGGNIAPGAARRVERSASLTLADDPDEFDTISDAIFRTAARRDGFVLRSSLSQGERGLAGGYFELRIPAAELGPALNELSRLATVRARNESGNDVTGTFVSIRDRLRRARAEQRGLLRRLERAEDDMAARAIRRRLDIVEQRIASLRGQLRGVRERTRYATVVVELVDEDAGAATGATEDAIDDAVGSLEGMLNFLIRALGVLVPLAIVGLGAWLVATRGRRRARERALA